MASDGRIPREQAKRSLDIFSDDLNPSALAREAARQAILQLKAIDAPAGPMEVVLGNGWPGILLHEAIGHGLEADFNRKQTSHIFRTYRADCCFGALYGCRDGTIPFRRGSLNVDDVQQRKCVLIEGVLQAISRTI
jgi:TldD protein